NDLVAWIRSRIAGRESLTDWISSRQISLHKSLVDDRHGRSGRTIVWSKIATLEQFRAGRREVALADKTLSRTDWMRRVKRLAMQLNDERVLRGASHRKVRSAPDCRDSWQPPEPFDQSVRRGAHSIPVWILRTDEGHVEDQALVGAESEIRVAKAGK